jgi:hypothetical protein
MQFDTHVDIKTNTGYYDWCGNDYAGEKHGVYLSYPSTKPLQIMLNIDITVDLKLWSQIDIIEIFDVTGFLAQYSEFPVKQNPYHFKFSIDKKLIGSELKVCYQKALPQTESGNKFLRRRPMKTIHSELVRIPPLDPKCDSVCVICLESIEQMIIDQVDLYISTCHHCFHMKCLWEYLEQNNYLIPLKSHCKRWCSHGTKSKSFPCPACRTPLEN